MIDRSTSARHAKGTNLIELIKALKVHQRARPIEGLSPAAQELLETRILVSDWYPHEPFLELLKVLYERLLGRSQERALQVGIAGSTVALQTTYRAYIHKGDPAGSVLAMRHIWRAFFDFGELKANLEPDGSVQFVLTGYLDVPPVHAALFTAWTVAAARLAGSDKARVEIVEAPWNGADRLVYRASF
jgi:hypothetical protein